MRKGIFRATLYGVALLATHCFAHEPLLIDVKVTGGVQSPLFEPQNFQLDVGQDYLLVITNTSSDSIAFQYDTFGQKVFTRSIYGTSSMTQDSIVISGNSKVQWHFSPQVPGEYTYYAVNAGLNMRGTPGKIMVKKAPDGPPINVSRNDAQKIEEAQQADMDKKEKPKEEKKNPRLIKF